MRRTFLFKSGAWGAAWLRGFLWSPQKLISVILILARIGKNWFLSHWNALDARQVAIAMHRRPIFHHLSSGGFFCFVDQDWFEMPLSNSPLYLQAHISCHIFPNVLSTTSNIISVSIFNFPQNGHFQACLRGSPRVAKGFQGPRGTPGMGEMSYNQIDHV